MLTQIILTIVVLLVLVVLAVVVAAYRKPPDFRVSRSIATGAKPADIFPYLNDLHLFRKWSPFEHLDPGMKTEHVGPPGGGWLGLQLDGDKRVGAGRMTILASHPDRQVESKLEFLRPFACTNQIVWRIDDEGSQRRIHWIMTGRNEGFMPRVMAVVMNLDKMVGPDFEKGLASLKQLAENPSTSQG